MCRWAKRSAWVLVGVILIVTLALQRPASAERRVALVIGNSAYEHTAALGNPRNDAADMAAALGDLGFEVTRVRDANQRQLRRSLAQFRRAAADADVALVFFAGHGIEVERTNFLVPVDAELKSVGDVAFEAVSLDLVLRAVEGASQLRLVILDACRDNPFARDWQGQEATRSTTGRGLARVEPSGDTLVAYAAKGGTTAADGSGRNSPYTAALLAHIAEPGVEVGLLFRKVRDRVLETTGGRQEPFVYGSRSSRNFYFAPLQPEQTPEQAAAGGGEATASAPEPAPFDDRQVDLALWEAIRDGGSIAAYEAYLRQFPEGVFATVARLEIEKLRQAASGETQPAPDVSASQAEAAEEADGGAGTFEVAVLPQADPETDPTPERAEVALALSREDRRLVQRALNDLKHPAGVVDGVFGRRTRGAIEGWQLAAGLAGTGYLTDEQAEDLIAHGREVKPAVQVAAQPGTQFRDCETCPEMVVVPAGSFRMGDLNDAGFSDEKPVHEVRIPRSFAVGLYEVTFAQWDACVAEGGCSHRPGDRGWGRGSQPVIGVSWSDAQGYLRWLTEKTGARYRLLSEAEWEYVARAGSSSKYSWGNALGRNQANCDGCGSRWDNRSPAPVGSFRPNRFGLFDVHGNVMEWVQDCWHGSYLGAPGRGAAWGAAGGGDCAQRVLRGGSWLNFPRDPRSALRFKASAGARTSNFGFRVARAM